MAVDRPTCRVHHPRINEAVDLVLQVVKEQQIWPYNERTGAGELRYVQLTANTRESAADTQSEEYLSAPVQVRIILL